MPLVISCPSCSRQLRLPDELQGKPVKCPSCMTQFTADSSSGQVPILESVTSTPPAAMPPMAAPSEGSPASDFAFGDHSGDDAGDFAASPRARNLARSRVSGPAVTLMVLIGISLAIHGIRLLILMVAV